MKTLYILLAIFLSVAANSQTQPVLRKDATAPKLKPLQPADLVITNATLVHAAWDPSVKGWVMRVNITIKNSGGIESPAGILIGLIKKNGTAQLNPLTPSGTFTALKPNRSVTKDYTFIDKNRVVGETSAFGLIVRLDSQNMIREGNENYNDSILFPVNGAQ